MESENVILLTSHPLNIDIDGKAILKQRRTLKQQQQQQQHQHVTSTALAEATADPSSSTTTTTTGTKPIYIRHPVKTKRSGSWTNHQIRGNKSSSVNDAAPIALSSPTLFVDHPNEEDHRESKPEMTSSCGSLLHFEIVPPTPKKPEDESVSSCFNFEAGPASSIVSKSNELSSSHGANSVHQLTIPSDEDEDDEVEDELRTPKAFFSGPMFLMPNVRDPELSSRQVKDRMERAMADHPGLAGATYLQVPMNVPRRRHSWICG